ncbi:MAG: hypothetical protein LUC99_06015 [Clostridiales bacterium]|nr:hypothetical protein [Clostridiales bacterium]
MKIQKGFSHYGQEIGILVNASVSPRVPGDAGHAASFGYPVQYQITGTSFMDMVEGAPDAREKLIRAARTLKNAGCRGIVADCGLMSLYQNDVAREVGIPFVGASLIQIPIVWHMVGCNGTIGIITGHSDFLKPCHLCSSGWTDEIPLAIEGMQTCAHFHEIVICGGMNLNTSQMCDEVVDAALALKRHYADLKAVILECSNLATYSRAVAEAIELPVFDTISAANLLQYGLCPPQYI